MTTFERTCPKLRCRGAALNSSTVKIPQPSMIWFTWTKRISGQIASPNLREKEGDVRVRPIWARVVLLPLPISLLGLSVVVRTAGQTLKEVSQSSLQETLKLGMSRLAMEGAHAAEAKLLAPLTRRTESRKHRVRRWNPKIAVRI